jgi:hypothetical protein
MGFGKILSDQTPNRGLTQTAVSKLPAPLKGAGGELFEQGIDYIEDVLKDKLKIGQPDVFEREGVTTYIDPHIQAARKQQLLYIRHVPSKKHIGLFAMLTSFSNSYNQQWGAEPVYGRADPIASYQNTSRSIQLGFKVVSADLKEAMFNYNKTMGRGGLERVSLSNMMYPTYKSVNGYQTIASPPIVALKHVQLLQSYGASVDESYLVGWFSNCTMTPDYAEGGYESAGGEPFIYPKIINISMSFNVLHDYDQGWKASTGFIAELFPELGSGEDIGRILAGREGAQFGEGGAILGGLAGGILGGTGDDFVNETVSYTGKMAANNQTVNPVSSNDQFGAGDAPSANPVAAAVSG